MSSRAERRRRQRAEHKAKEKGLDVAPLELPEGHWALQPGWCEDESDVEVTKQFTHDALIEGMGDDRTGPVRWFVRTGDELPPLLALLQSKADDDPNGDWAIAVAEIRRRWLTTGGWLVVAVAPGVYRGPAL